MAKPLFEYEDFSGGISDDIVHCAPNKYNRADNLLINDDNYSDNSGSFSVRIQVN